MSEREVPVLPAAIKDLLFARGTGLKRRQIPAGMPAESRLYQVATRILIQVKEKCKYSLSPASSLRGKTKSQPR